MRRIAQPGPEAPERVVSIAARGRPFRFAVERGLPLLEGVRRGFEAAGFSSGVLSFAGGGLEPLAYVMPALSPSPDHAAFYSDIRRPDGMSRLLSGAMTLGERDGAPFFHAHALWIEADGRLSGGHILPEGTTVAEAFEVDAFGLDGAAFVAAHDPETNFTLLGPAARPSSDRPDAGPAFALRLRPNGDFAGTLEAFCRERGIARARLHGGVGSIVGARFADGRAVEPFATEAALAAGSLEPDEGGETRAHLDVALVDHAGGVSQGRLVRGDNPVLMTFELIVQPL